MTQVSRFRLKPEVENKISDLFSEVLLSFKKKGDLTGFLDDFFSPTEKIVSAKRLAVAVLLTKGNDYASIVRSLRVTPPTISKMSLKIKYGNGSVKKISEKIVNSDLGMAILQELLSILDVPIKGLPISDYRKKVQRRERKIHKLLKKI